MIEGLYQSAAASDALQAWNDAIARNIASSNIPGYKRASVSFEGVLAGTLASGLSSSDQVNQTRVAPEIRADVSFQSGEMKRSGDPHEFAIEGPGFFRLQAPDGSNVYTRDGQFRVSSDGRLVSKQGYNVVGDAGPIQLLIDGGPLAIDSEGRLRQGNQEVGVLAVFDFANPEQLQRTSGGYAVDSENPQDPARAEDSRVHQGMLELSNVSAIREMADLVLVSNALQANQRVIQSMDDLSERAVQVLGNINS